VGVSPVAWHDLECGGYRADLPLWRELAAAAGGPILDLGAGAGRVALDLAARGHAVTAIEIDAALAEAIAERAAGMPVRVLTGDARELRLGARFPLVICAMQSVQLMGGAPGRRRLLERVREHLAPGGLAAISIVSRLQTFEGELVVPDVGRVDGTTLVSRPIAVRREQDCFVLERVRETITGGRHVPAGLDVVRIDRVSRRTLENEALAAGLRAREPRRIRATAEHAGSMVVMLAE
jgi:SAM-dependent methyltransferase